MTAFLDGIEIPSHRLAPGLTAGELINRLQTQLRETGEMILVVACDREEVPPNGLDQVMALPVSSIDRLDMISGRPEEVVLEALEQTRASLANSLSVVRRSADDLLSGKVEEGMVRLVSCVETWADVHEAVTQGGALVHINFDQTVLESRDIRGCLNDIHAKLHEIKEAAVSGDHLLLCDILRYETNETLRNWETMLDNVIEQVKQLAEQPAAAPVLPPVSLP